MKGTAAQLGKKAAPPATIAIPKKGVPFFTTSFIFRYQKRLQHFYLQKNSRGLYL
jgi:hypothetical protein